MSQLLRTAMACAWTPMAVALESLRPGMRILMYHRVNRFDRADQLAVSPERFDEQMALLAGSRRIVTLAQALAELERGVQSPGVAVTFDDGYLDNLVNAAPILQRRAIPATVFVTSTFCDQSRVHPRYTGEAGRVHLDWDEVRALATMPGISIGSHSATHPFLSRLPEPDATREIRGSREAIAKRLGAPPEFFCYPSGDFGDREVRLVREAGYRGAVSVAPGLNRSADAPFALLRTEMTDRDEAFQTRLKLAGGFDLAHSVLHARRERSFRRHRSAIS